MANTSSIRHLLESTKLMDTLHERQSVVTLEHDMTVGQALQQLARYKILSAPVVLSPDLEDLEGGGEPNLSPQLLGWMDVADILQALLAFLQEGDTPTSHRTMPMLKLMTRLEERGPDFAKKTLVTIRGKEDRGLMYQAEGAATSVMSAVRNLFLGRDRTGDVKIVHRVALFEPHGEISAVVSQMDVVAWLLRHVDQLGPAADRTLGDLGLLTGKPPVVTVNPHDPTLVAFDSLARAGVSGAPVVTDAGELIANLSVSDLRALTPDHFGILALPVAEFLAVQHGTTYLGYAASSSGHAFHPFFAGKGPSSIHIYTVGEGATLRELLQQLVQHRIHRVYVVKEGAPGSHGPKVDAVVSLTDVLRLVAGVW